MKKILLLAVFSAFAPSAFAAGDGVAIDCSANRDNVTYTLKAKNLVISEDKTEGTMWGVTMTTQEDSQKMEIGRAATLEGKKNVRARKYTKHVQFSANDLTDTKDFSKYYPMGCNVVLNVPNTIDNGRKATVEIPVNLTCEQGGTLVTLSCDITPSN